MGLPEILPDACSSSDDGMLFCPNCSYFKQKGKTRALQALRIAQRISQGPRARPEWWSPAWEELTELARSDRTSIELLPPGQFKEEVSDDVFMMDEIGTELGKDPNTGEQTNPNIDPALIHMASGAVWNEQGTTLIRKGAKGGDPNELLLNLFESAAKLIPNGCGMRYATHSDWLMEQ
jgi:hypothetical protein